MEALSYSLTFFFHMIPGLTETFMRLPRSLPLFTGPDDPRLTTAIGEIFAVFLIGAILQTRRIWIARRAPLAKVRAE